MVKKSSSKGSVVSKSSVVFYSLVSLKNIFLVMLAISVTIIYASYSVSILGTLNAYVPSNDYFLSNEATIRLSNDTTMNSIGRLSVLVGVLSLITLVISALLLFACKDRVDGKLPALNGITISLTLLLMTIFSESIMRQVVSYII